VTKARTGRVRIAILALLIVSGVGLRAWLTLRLPHEVANCAADFSAFYAGGKLAGMPQLYLPEAAFAAEKAAVGCSMENLVYIKPPFYALLMWPLAQLPFATAFIVWRVLGLIALGWFLWWWPGDRWVAAAAMAWFPPVAANFTVGQDVALLLLAVAAGWRMLRADRLYGAGVVLGLCAFKFHLFLLLPLLFLHKRLWRSALGVCGTGIVLLGASFVAGGPYWVRDYLGALQDNRLNPLAANMINLRGLLGYGSPWIVPVSVVVIGLCWYAIRAGSLEVALGAVLVGGVLVAPHTTVNDGVLWLPVLLWAQRAPAAAVRALATFALTPLYRFLPPGALQVIMLGLLGYGVWMVRTSASCRPAPPAAATPSG
jgi:hypothetical protein